MRTERASSRSSKISAARSAGAGCRGNPHVVMSPGGARHPWLTLIALSDPATLWPANRAGQVGTSMRVS